MTPDVLLKEIGQHGMSTAQVADEIDVSTEYLVKLRSGERKTPSYIIMDKIRELHKRVVND